MLCPRVCPAALAGALLVCAQQASAQEPALRLQRSYIGAPRPSEPVPTFIYADRITGIEDKETTAEGDAEIRKGNLSIHADWMRYTNEGELVEARGNVRIEREGDVLSGPGLRYRVGDGTGVFDRPQFMLAPRAKPERLPTTGRGQADSVEILGEDRIKVKQAYFTTCKPGDDSWSIRARELDLDYTREEGTARGAAINFMGVTLFKTPYLDFSLNNRRKSGFLPPHVGSTGKSGAELSLPYYWNIAPHRDLTITPREMSKRGLQVGSEFRYLDRNYSGTFRGEVLRDQQLNNETRSATSLFHSYADGPLSAGLNLNKVSDDNYFRDLASRINITSQVNLVRDGFVNYGGHWWDTGTYGVTARVQNYQTLQDPAAPVPIPYARRPQLSLSATRLDVAGFDFNAAGEYVDFGHPTSVVGRRAIGYPSLTLPMLTPAAYLTPKVGVHATHYSLTREGVAFPGTMERSVPITSVDSGLVLERDLGWRGQSFTQTLEPRAYYVYIPYRNQDRIPIFDTAVADLNYAQIFSENAFAGGDRINDANQLTLAMTSRLLGAQSGQESLRATVAQRYYFSDQRVTLNPGDPRRQYQFSDWLAALSGRIAPQWTAETAAQYNSREGRTERLTVSARYQPDFLKTLNLSYRYLRDQIAQVDTSAQWPFGGGWYGVGRVNYSTRDKRLVEALAGIEYNADCWVGRFVVQRFALAPGTSTSTLFLQLELNGFSRIGSNPLETLRRNIPGYQRLNTVAPETARPFD